MNKKLLYIGLITISITYNCASASSKATLPETKLCVSSDNGLKIRESPNQSAKQLGLAKYSESVSILNYSENSETIGNITAKWANVRYGKLEGWAFAGFLKENCPKLENEPKYDGLKSYTNPNYPLFTLESTDQTLGTIYRKSICDNNKITECYRCSYEAGGADCKLISMTVTETIIRMIVKHSNEFKEHNGNYVCETSNGRELEATRIVCYRK
ncbi:SH3 domain-containing protein [Leptospira saintgironsiae]|uniref:SH3b domain-containing protein n=1 Tax=Leptospira saintgironsiae TaxID=2023183 RepID=A0A2M9YE07_9LEPT|nr:SH3 domain-containing protein [Leptospira saintgironsiae]PJZ49778.1 hypothetical protein CH362_05470 [Leptospira saintgironsiae]